MNEKLVFTWAWKTTPEHGPLVTVLFKPGGGGTPLTLTHELWFDDESRDSHELGRRIRQAQQVYRLSFAGTTLRRDTLGGDMAAGTIALVRAS